MMNKMLFIISISCLNVLYMYIIYVGVCYCNHETITCGTFDCCFGLWSSFFNSIPIQFPYGVAVLFGTSCCDVTVLFILMFLQFSLFFSRLTVFMLCVLTSCVWWWLHKLKHVAIPLRQINALYTMSVSEF
jgi:hypothetical protein